VTAAIETTEDFMGRIMQDMGAAVSGALVKLGDELGLYCAMAEAGPLDSAELARLTGTHERYVREWLAAQAAAGYADYDAGQHLYSLNEAQAAVLADEDGLAFGAGGFQSVAAVWRDEPKIREAFKSGEGVGWHDHSACLFRGTERFFRPAYKRHLVNEWIPSLDGVKEKLEAGARVADVGCGHGSSSILLAQAFPNSEFVGFDAHAPSIDNARIAAKDAGVDDRVRFEVATAKDYPGTGYDLVTFFDCLHDMGDPTGAAMHVLETLAPEGRWMLVEPFANDNLADNLNPVGRLYYGFSTMVCTPASRAQEVGACLGAQAGEGRLRSVLTAAGFGSVRRAAETAVNMVLEARA
jgi:2-polyprenyl-3-methyl-5-hydroxy-6-metoxy-1,4-benzoquinol methylase